MKYNLKNMVFSFSALSPSTTFFVPPLPNVQWAIVRNNFYLKGEKGSWPKGSQEIALAWLLSLNHSFNKYLLMPIVWKTFAYFPSP